MNKVKKKKSQHLDALPLFATINVCSSQSNSLIVSRMVSIHDDVFIFLILTDMQCLYGSNNTVSRTVRRGCERTDFLWLLFALSLTMMLLHVRAEECRL